MKLKILLLAVICVVFAGCGDIEWFPDKTNGFGNFTGSTNKPTSPVLTMAYSPKAIFAGYSTTLTYTITNGSGNPAQTGLAFVDTLNTTLTAAKVSSTCNADISTHLYQINVSNGQLPKDTANCVMTFKVKTSSTTEGSLSNNLSGLSGLTNTTTPSLKVFPVSVKDGTGKVTASGLKVIFIEYSTDGENTATNEVEVGVTNTGAEVGVKVQIVAVDNEGQEIASTARPIPGVFSQLIPGNQSTPILINAAIAVPKADMPKIRFWIIKAVEVS